MSSYVLANPSKSNANPSQCNANFMPFPRAICPHNLGTSPLYGIVSSPLGGRNSCYPVATQCKSEANPGPLLGTIQNQSGPIQANPVPIRCQSVVNFSIQYQFSNFQKLCQPLPIRVNPRSFFHFAKLPILASLCQFYVEPQIQSHSVNLSSFSSANSKTIHQSYTARLLVQA